FYSLQSTSTAVAGADYAALSGSVTIPPNVFTAVINVNVLDDSYVERSETVVINLDGITSGDPQISLTPTLANRTATVTISDNDVFSPVPAENTVTVLADLASPGKQMIVVVGTAANETILAEPTGANLQIRRNGVIVSLVGAASPPPTSIPV